MTSQLGGPPHGNQNARQHGLYSQKSPLPPAEQIDALRAYIASLLARMPALQTPRQIGLALRRVTLASNALNRLIRAQLFPPAPTPAPVPGFGYPNPPITGSSIINHQSAILLAPHSSIINHQSAILLAPHSAISNQQSAIPVLPVSPSFTRSSSTSSTCWPPPASAVIPLDHAAALRGCFRVVSPQTTSCPSHKAPNTA